MKAEFILDKEYDAQAIWFMLQEGYPAGLESRAESMKLDLEVAKQISGKKYDQVEELIKRLVDERYSQFQKEIETAVIDYQSVWDKINDKFFSEIQKITENNWAFEEYHVVISPFHPGVSNRNSNVVIRWCFENPEDQKRITAHEITMIQIWDYFEKNMVIDSMSDDKWWALNEITTTALLGLEPVLDELWSERTKGYDQYLKNYPHIRDLQMKLKDLYLTKSDFKSFLEESVEFMK